MNKDLETLKRRWKELDSASPVQDPSTPFCPASAVKVSSRRQKLMNYYRRLTIIGIIFIWVTPIAIHSELNFPLWATILISVYFAVMAGICYMMYDKIKRLDFGNTPTVRLLEQVESIYRSFNRHTTFGIMAATPIVILMLYFLHVNYAAFIGGITGAILGAIIGFINNVSVRRHIREIREELAIALAK